MTIRRLAVLLGGIVAATLLPCAYSQPNAEAEHQRRFEEFQAFVKKAVGENAVVSPEGFGRTVPGSAITMIRKNADDESPKVFAVTVAPNEVGVSLGFIRYGDCTSGSPSAPTEQFIKVDGQKIAALYACKPEPSRPGAYRNVYVPKSKEALVFIRKRFALVRYAYVELDNFTVPFNTEGFGKTWAEADGVAL